MRNDGGRGTSATTIARQWLGWIGAGLAIAWALSLLWWLVLEPASAGSDVFELTIPKGTAEAVAAGEPPPLIPNSLELGRNKKMVVRNNDSVDHRLGAWTIPPGSVAEIVASDTDGQVSCTIRPGGLIDVTSDERPPFVTTVLSALGVGLPLGLVLGFAAFVNSWLKPRQT